MFCTYNYFKEQTYFLAVRKELEKNNQVAKYSYGFLGFTGIFSALKQDIFKELLQRQQPGSSKWLSISNLRSAPVPFF